MPTKCSICAPCWFDFGSLSGGGPRRIYDQRLGTMDVIASTTDMEETVEKTFLSPRVRQLLAFCRSALNFPLGVQRRCIDGRGRIAWGFYPLDHGVLDSDQSAITASQDFERIVAKLGPLIRLTYERMKTRVRSADTANGRLLCLQTDFKGEVQWTGKAEVFLDCLERCLRDDVSNVDILLALQLITSRVEAALGDVRPTKLS